MTRTLKTLAATAALATSLAVGACSSNDTTSGHQMPGDSMTAMGSAPATPSGAASAASAHNQADITFASSMVPHHQQAIEMADLALRQATSADVKKLATQIKAAQDPEIATMTGWLTSWGAAPMPSGDHDMDGMSMDGMMSAEEMSALEKASGSGFDRMWLQLMIKHHEGAVTMARTQLSQGQSGDAKELAQAVIDGQTKEIATMTELLKTSL
ncbi:lipoprotein [Terrabacter tumescens]|uniref:Lipoprotein n=1 Tax=Terrabacter tumescens TaxID=60443 RepID=A0ABQ2I8K0_9MICO|nr:DUF305 domain-containing protein [Terrabacter tumescens]GGN02614.1 lipoprotein [Terrabacter tumescens]